MSPIPDELSTREGAERVLREVVDGTHDVGMRVSRRLGYGDPVRLTLRAEYVSLDVDVPGGDEPRMLVHSIAPLRPALLAELRAMDHVDAAKRMATAFLAAHAEADLPETHEDVLPYDADESVVVRLVLDLLALRQWSIGARVRRASVDRGDLLTEPHVKATGPDPTIDPDETLLRYHEPFLLAVAPLMAGLAVERCALYPNRSAQATTWRPMLRTYESPDPIRISSTVDAMRLHRSTAERLTTLGMDAGTVVAACTAPTSPATAS